MAKKNDSHENDSAFIADLLNKLRQQMEAPPETSAVSNSPDREEDAFKEEIKETLAQASVYTDAGQQKAEITPVTTTKKAEPASHVDADSQFVMDIPAAPQTSQVDNAMDMMASMRATTRESDRVAHSMATTSITAVEPEQLALAFDETPVELPVPDEDRHDDDDIPPGPPVGTASSTDASKTADDDIPPSIWNLPQEGTTDCILDNATDEDVDDPWEAFSPKRKKNIPEHDFHATKRLPRRTFADVDFDATPGGGIYSDKLLCEPLESIGGEHSDEQIEQWRRDLEKRRRFGRLGLIIAAALVGLLALFELVLVQPLTDWFYGQLLLIRVPGVFQLVDLQLLILVCLIGYRPIYRGFAALRFGRVMPETLASFAATVSLTSGMVFYFSAGDKFTCNYLFGLAGALVVFGAIFADFCRIESLACSFRVYIADGKHHAGVFSDAREHLLLGSRFHHSTETVPLMEIVPVTQIDGFVASTRERVEERRSPLVALIVAGVIALADLIVLLVMPQFTVPFAFWSALITFLAVVPISGFLTHRFLYWMLSSHMFRERICVTGEKAVYRYAGVSVMTFDDTEAFPSGSVRVNGIKLCGDFRLDKALYLVSGVFDRVGGPLNSVFKTSTSDIRIAEDVTIRELCAEGINARVNREDVCVGTRAHLESVGIEVYHDIEDERAEAEGNRVLYVAYLGILVAKFYVKYDISTAFEKNVENYAKQGVSSVIMTADPLLNASVLDKISYVSDYDVKFEKYDLAALLDEHKKDGVAEVLTYGSRKTLRRMPLFFRKYMARQRVVSILSMIGVSLSAIAAPLLIAALQPNTVLWVFLCQLITAIPGIVIGLLVRRLHPNS